MKFIPGIIKDCINNKHPVKLRNGNKAYVFCDIRDYGLDFSRYVIRGSLTCGAEITWTAQHRMEREYHILLVAPMAQLNVILVYELDKAYELCYDYLTRGRMG